MEKEESNPVMSNPKIIMSFDDLYDNVKNDNPDFMDEKEFQLIIDDLIANNIIQPNLSNDIIYYSASPQLKRSHLVTINDSTKMSIILLLIDNNNTFFVYLNTQKGKMKVAAKEIKSWGQDKLHKVVAIMVTDNDKSLTDQSVDGIKKTFHDQPVKLFTLSSNSTTKFDDIKTYIDAYANSDDTDEYPMPLIVSLANPKQGEKIVKILNHINKKIERANSKLRYAPLFDEADKTYPVLRDRPYLIDREEKTFASFVLEHSRGLYRLGFVSATEGGLLDESDYPECANAQQYPVEISEEDQKDYRALHHPESIVHRIPYPSKQTHNEYAKYILDHDTYRDHFTTPIELPSGERYYRKVIVNSNARTEDMRVFARWCNTKQMNALVFNGYGGASVKIYKPEMNGVAIKTKGRELREVLMYVYKKYELGDKPLIIIGRRKVDRGLGFHYCPRSDEEIIIKDMGMGDLVIRNRESLIWTDVILGRIEDKNTAVQKAGRGAGIIGSSPQYPGHICYWTDDDTADMITRHNKIVDLTNNTMSVSISHAVKIAKNAIRQIQRNHKVSLDMFLVYTTDDTVKKVCELLDFDYRRVSPNSDGFFETSLNKKKEVVSLLDAIKKVPSAYGAGKGGYRSYYPCYKDTTDKHTLHFVIPLIRPNINRDRLDQVKREYPSIEIPQEGPF